VLILVPYREHNHIFLKSFASTEVKIEGVKESAVNAHPGNDPFGHIAMADNEFCFGSLMRTSVRKRGRQPT
jgi:hypothetical protein